MALQQPSRYMTFSSSPQRPQGGFPQSLSGSETDVSTSNENLSNEEKYVIRHTARQEPQGQENLSSNRSSLDVSSSSYNTLIIHGAGEEPWTGRLSGLREPTGHKAGSHSPSPSLGGSKDTSSRTSFDASTSSRTSYDPSVREITDIPDDYLSQSQVLKHLAKEVKVVPTSSDRDSSLQLLDDSAGCSVTVTENSCISEQLKRLSLNRKENESLLQLNYNNPPPDYPKWANMPSPLSAIQKVKLASHSGLMSEKLNLSRSQPDLSRLGSGKVGSDVEQCRGVSTSPRPKTNGREDVSSHAGREIWPSAEMVEILVQENSSLKLELEACYQKVAKSQKLEQEVSKVHRAHEELVQSSDRRERLERAARVRLQSEVRRLQDANRVIREQVELLSSRPPSELVGQLIAQNKELAAARERQEIELAAQRATLQEQRTHIDILDTALTNAQGNVVRLEEECRKKQVYAERAAQLQRALSSLQLASDRREQTERKLRLQLERELRSARGGGPGGEGEEMDSNSQAPMGETAPELKRRLRERDEKIMRLEGEVAKWERRYLEESALRQAAIDAASIPKDAKIAALEKTSQETEKMIAEARSEKIRQMDEVHAAQKKVADLESRTKDLESKLAERDAMIRVLQKHAYDKQDVSSSSSSYPSMLGRSPHHTPHASDLGGPVSTASVFSTVSSALTSSSFSADYQSFDDTNKTLDDQLKELDSQLDSQLLSKRGLCCFPGFSNTSTTPRKGKIPKPLLASVGVGGASPHHLFLQGLVPGRYEQGRPEEILLLEKQGRSSQQQRMQEACLGARGRSGSLPPSPSSLPRPRRPSGKLGEYGRLSDGEGQKAPPTPPKGRSGIPPPRRLGQYGRLSDGEVRKPSTPGGRDSATSGSEDSASQSKLRLLPPPRARPRASSQSHETKPGSADSTSTRSVASSGKYRIQF